MTGSKLGYISGFNHNYVFDDVSKSYLYVPESSLNSYTESLLWTGFGHMYAIKEVKEITINNPPTSIDVGQSRSLTVSFSPRDATDKTLEWSSSDESIAVIDQDGIVTGISPGNVKITVRSGIQIINCELTVGKLPQEITWNQSFDDVKEGDVITLTASASSGLPVSYKIEKGESLASISGDVLTFIKAGDIKVTAKQPGNDEFEPAESVSKSITIASGIEDVIADNNGRYIVHNLQGCLILDTDDIEKINSLEHGIYIINGVKVVK